eukprot:4011670-Pyramimonas_sp.AAC.1
MGTKQGTGALSAARAATGRGPGACCGPRTGATAGPGMMCNERLFLPTGLLFLPAGLWKSAPCGDGS